MIAKVAKLIAPVQTTIYGDIFDVLSSPNPINIAYSTEELGWHMDLMYYERYFIDKIVFNLFIANF